MNLLLENDFVQVFEHADEKVVRVVRSDRRGEPSEIVDAHRAAFAALRPQHASWGVLIDLRKAPGRTDDSFERSLEVLHNDLASRVARVVLLVRSAVGKLQVSRLSRQSGRASFATRDEAEAMRWAAGAE